MSSYVSSGFDFKSHQLLTLQLTSEGIRLCILHFCLEDIEAYRYWHEKTGRNLGGQLVPLRKLSLSYVHPLGLGVFWRGKEPIVWMTHGPFLRSPVILS